jgi:NAD-dependent SIR2 family protein deacetylase
MISFYEGFPEEETKDLVVAKLNVPTKARPGLLSLSIKGQQQQPKCSKCQSSGKNIKLERVVNGTKYVYCSDCYANRMRQPMVMTKSDQQKCSEAWNRTF